MQSERERPAFDVRELRVHGVGGATPEGLLGVAMPSDTVTVADDGMAGFHARRERASVEGYVWGNLTQKPLLQPLWLVLLPFTLVNVAGWMHPPRTLFRGQWAEKLFPVFRWTVLVIGFGLTSIYVFWPARIVVNFLYGMQRTTWPHSPHARIVAAGVLMAIFVMVVAFVAGYRQSKFERYEAPDLVKNRRAGDASDPGKDRSLRDPTFWSRPDQATRLLRLHVVAALACVAGMIWYAWGKAPDRYPPALSNVQAPSLSLVRFPILATVVVLVVVTLLVPVQWTLWKRPGGFWTNWRGHVGFRWIGPAVAASIGVSLATELFYGLSLSFYHGDPETQALGVAFGLGSLSLGGAIILFGGWIWWRRRGELGRVKDSGASGLFVPSNTPPEGIASEQPVGATDAVRKRIAMGRTLSEAGRNVDLLLFAPMPVFLTAALWQLGPGHPWTFDTVRNIGELVSKFGATAVLGFLIYRSRKPGERKIVGIIWDVLTFWPRRFHPFAVRPYAERSVPELQRRLLYHIAGPRPAEKGGERNPHNPPRRVILSTHSQGTVLGYAALVQLPENVRREIAFVTYGSPLRQLHQMAFPAYFDQDGFGRLRDSLWNGGDAALSWRSFHRLTDYIGKRVFDEPGYDEIVPDPAEGPALPASATAAMPLPYPDPPRSPWVELDRHSFYNQESVLKAWIARLKAAMP
jgi:hypothetical protein